MHWGLQLRSGGQATKQIGVKRGLKVVQDLPDEICTQRLGKLAYECIVTAWAVDTSLDTGKL
jgi:hypothetical protein